MKLIYDVNDRPGLSKTLLFAFQQMIAIMAATLLVPMLMSGFAMSNGNTLSFDPAAALFGAGIGTLFYTFATKRRSPVFLGSSFTFLGAYAAIIGMNYGYWGVIIGITLAGLVYAVLAIIIKLVGSGWVNKLMPPVIAGPIVTIIGLSLSSTATGWMSTNGGTDYSLVTILVGAVTFFAIVLVSVKGSKNLRLIPFIIGVGAGYIFALILTLIGNAADIAALQILSFDSFKAAFDPFTIQSIVDYPKFTFLQAMTDKVDGIIPIDAAAIGNIAITFVPIAIVELAQHIADHKNLSSIIEASHESINKTAEIASSFQNVKDNIFNSVSEAKSEIEVLKDSSKQAVESYAAMNQTFDALQVAVDDIKKRPDWRMAQV